MWDDRYELVDKLTANRMKKRGMSWTIRGAHRMAKVIQLNRNGELSEFCRSRRRSDRGETDPAPAQHREVVSKTRVSDWVEMSVPALSGPHNSRPWAHSLRNLVQPPHRLNWYRLGLRVTGFELFVDKEVEVKEVGIRSPVLSAVRSGTPARTRTGAPGLGNRRSIHLSYRGTILTHVARAHKLDF